MGSTQHPVIGNYGVMAAKNTAINTIVLTIGLCLVIYRRCNKAMTVSWVRQGNIFLVVLFAAAEANILFLGIYGFYVPARVRVALALPQFITALTTLVAGYGINGLMLRGARSLGPIRWGRLPKPGAYALFALALLITLTMILMGYIRSSVRLDWHVNEIMRDASPWAATPPIGRAFTIIFLNLGLFWGLVVAVLSFSRRGAVLVLAPVSNGSEELSPPDSAPLPSDRSMDLAVSKKS
jgi:hypothetical protein